MVSQKAQPFQHFLKHVFDKQITQAKRAESGPSYGTPTMAHFHPPEFRDI